MSTGAALVLLAGSVARFGKVVCQPDMDAPRDHNTTMEAPLPMHIAMFPWFAMGHFIPYLHFSNKLAIRGHKISFFIPKNTLNKLQHLNLHPNLITFFPINVPHVDGLPHDAETSSDVPFSLVPLIATAMDQTEKQIELLLKELKPDILVHFLYLTLGMDQEKAKEKD
ncbi:hypothetical protein TSUD_102280 [Trifolium subterraneum]|uniref:Anthocyanidin 3-O-glucosyltransferase n=1 Tax=Trifolium subterraneum TaxID=3900 RepID=A0A2Z6M3C6_TRISU|nr:hypothetical protein TSUD_102280 [Trifolium subterraneum]